jgi:Mn-dependent DtxR family transcriptional regulator
MSLSKIADVLGVEPSTVARNKKRLCALFYRQISK